MGLKRITADSYRNSGMRGVNCLLCWQPYDARADLAAAKEIGADHVRVGIKATETAAGMTIDDAQIETLQRYATWCQAAGLYIVLVLGPDTDKLRSELWRNTKAAAKLRLSLTALWVRIATLFINRVVFAGFDFFNEATLVDRGTTAAVYYAWVEETVADVTAADRRRVCIVQVFPDARPDGEYGMPPRAIPGVVYSVHDWSPTPYTHAGWWPWAAPAIKEYSAAVRSAHLESLLPFATWCRQEDAPGYVGESGAANVQPGHVERLELSSDLARGFGLSWAGHAFRMWPAWDFETVWSEKTPTSAEEVATSPFVRRGDTPGAVALRRALAG